ncbi:group 10 secretory phospholipase A2 [Sarcophilus harrisii]
MRLRAYTCTPEQMEPVYLLLLLLFTTVSGKSHVHRRGLLELAGALSCATSRSALAYVSYGCYCGLGGTGWPKDQTDWCCQKHDCCYSKVEEAGCGPKTERYDWKCTDQKVECSKSRDSLFLAQPLQSCLFFFFFFF